MGLYRNIAGVDPGQQMGLTLFEAPTLIHSAPSLIDTQNLLQKSIQNVTAETFARYDYLLSTPIDQLRAAGFYVTTDNGSIFQGDPNGYSKAYLPIQDIQMVENQRGTAGTLLLHFNEPVLAKDTAGYGGGASASTGGTTQYSDPIPEVAALPDQPTGPNVITEYNPPLYVQPTVDPLPGGGTSTPVVPSSPSTVIPTTNTTQKNIIPVLTAAGLAAVAVAGAGLLKKKQRLVFVGGLGLLYYMMSKNKTV